MILNKLQFGCIWFISTFKFNKFQKIILIWNYFPHFSLWKISVQLEKSFMLFFSFHISILQISSTLKLNKFQKCCLIWSYLPHFSLWKIAVCLEKITFYLFLPHFNNSSSPVGHCKSLPQLRKVFQYEIICHISVCGRFLYSWGENAMLVFSFHISTILQPL